MKVVPMKYELSFCYLISITEADCVSQGPSGGKLLI